jgi:hypothetical protein
LKDIKRREKARLMGKSFEELDFLCPKAFQILNGDGKSSIIA